MTANAKRVTLALALCFAVALSVLFGLQVGVFVQQPIGAAPDGFTVVYWRRGMDVPFVASVDGILLERTGRVSLLSRAVAFGTIGSVVVDRSVVRLPYS